MATHEKIFIIGIGDDGPDGITAQARRLIEEADLLVGAESTLKAIAEIDRQRTAGSRRQFGRCR